MEELDSREKFVASVSKVILDSNDTKEAFIFGLSGKWGEGKSTFLENLEEQLKLQNPSAELQQTKKQIKSWWKKNNSTPYISMIFRLAIKWYIHIKKEWKASDASFLQIITSDIQKQIPKKTQQKIAVINLNPWKYADADNSILRELLIELVKLDNNPFRKFVLKRKTKALYHDVKRSRIRWIPALILLAAFLVGILIYKHPPQDLLDLRNSIRANKSILFILFIPLALGVTNALTTSQSSTKAINTRDSFNSLFNELVKHLQFLKIVVYVDDMDRLTASKALSVMDNLRTFFDKPKLVFVVASDHTVLERHIGRELLPEAKPPEQFEEGRRFLKKIFNVYWRLPIPTKPEFNTYINKLIADNSDLKTWLLSPDSTDNLKSYMSRYFSNNYRNAERFISRINFTFGLIESQFMSVNQTEENRAYFKEMLDNPILVIRILLIEEMANPLFEKMQLNPEILLEIEKQVVSGNFEEVLDKYTVIATVSGEKDRILSDDQMNFLKSFLPTKPRFCDENGTHVNSIQTFVSYSSDSSLGGLKGLSPDEFLEFIENGSIPELVNILHGSSDQKLRESLDSYVSYMNNQSDAATKFNSLRRFIQTGLSTDPIFSARQMIKESIGKIALDFIDQLAPLERMSLLNGIGNLLDENLETEKTFADTPTLKETDFAEVNSQDSLSKLLQWKLLIAFKSYFSAETANDYLSRLATNLDKFSIVYTDKALHDFVPQLITYFMNNNDDQMRSSIVEILRKTKNGITELQEALRAQLGNKNRTIFNWVARDRKESSQAVIRSDEDVSVMTLLQNYGGMDPADLAERIGFFVSFPESKNVLWTELIKFNDTILARALHGISNIAEYNVLTPSNEAANELLKRIASSIKEGLEDDSEIYSWLQDVESSTWLYSGMVLNSNNRKIIRQKLKAKYPSEMIKVELDKILKQFSRS